MKVIKNFTGTISDCKSNLCVAFPEVHFLTLFSLVQTETVRKLKATFYCLPHNLEQCMIDFQTAKKTESYLKTDGILISIARKYGVSPLTVAKEVLKREFNVNETVAISYTRDSTLIDDPKIAFEVYLCLISDDQSGPLSDLIKQNFGSEYEQRLKKILEDNGICFKTETELQQIGYDKTPDFRLLIPIAINGIVINWIESKALFGCEYLHELYKNKQYFSYYNRFGTGLIIYWFNYIETLQKHIEHKWLISDHFPADFTTIT